MSSKNFKNIYTGTISDNMMNEDNVKKLIDFTLEITNGCQFSCTGCTVDMEGNSWPTDNDWNKISDLIDDFDKNEFRPMNLQIGPTDLMTSINRDQILTSIEVKNLASKFLKTAILLYFLQCSSATGNASISLHTFPTDTYASFPTTFCPKKPEYIFASFPVVPHPVKKKIRNRFNFFIVISYLLEL